jgi:hypothetical protein
MDMANQERPGTPPGTPEIDDPGTPHPSRKDREIQSPQPRTTPIENPKVRANEKRGSTPGKPGTPSTTPDSETDDDGDTETPQRPGRGDVNSPDQRRAEEGGRENPENPARDPERRSSTDRTGNR